VPPSGTFRLKRVVTERLPIGARLLARTVRSAAPPAPDPLAPPGGPHPTHQKISVCQEPYKPLGVARQGRRGSAMLSTEYFRRQADICLRLSVISSSEEAASQLIVMAHEYQTKADALEAHAGHRWPQSPITLRRIVRHRRTLRTAFMWGEGWGLLSAR
jgi:hypothetical protein